MGVTTHVILGININSTIGDESPKTVLDAKTTTKEYWGKNIFQK